MPGQRYRASLLQVELVIDPSTIRTAVDREVESTITRVAIAVIGGNEHRIHIAKPPCDRDLPGWRNGIVTRISDCGDIGTSAHIAIEDHLVLSGRKSLRRDCSETTLQRAISIHDSKEGARTAPTRLLLTLSSLLLLNLSSLLLTLSWLRLLTLSRLHLNAPLPIWC